MPAAKKSAAKRPAPRGAASNPSSGPAPGKPSSYAEMKRNRQTVGAADAATAPAEQPRRPRPDAAEARGGEGAARRPRPNDELARRRAERKKRGVTDHGFDRRLHVDEKTLHLGSYAYRWVNDDSGKVARLQSKEWEICDKTDLDGQEAARHAGMNKESQPMQAVLMRKWLPWYREDKAEQTEMLRKQDQALMSGKAAVLRRDDKGGPDYASEENSLSSVNYVPARDVEATDS